MRVNLLAVGGAAAAAVFVMALPAAPAAAGDKDGKTEAAPAATGDKGGRTGASTGDKGGRTGASTGDKGGRTGAATGDKGGRTGAATGDKGGRTGAATGDKGGQARSAPAAVEAAVDGDAARVTITWTLPDDNIAEVGFRLNGTTNVVCPETATDDGSCVLTEVPPGQYAVEYREDAGAWTDAAASADVPVAPPSGVTTTSTVHGLGVSWEPSASPGVTGYVATATPVGGGAPAQCTSMTGCAITGLAFGEYEVSVVTRIGEAASAAATVTASPLPETPAAPTGVTAKVSGPNAVTISWNAVPSAYGVPIRYMGAISTENAGRGCWDAPRNALSCTVGGLAAGTTYTVTAFAVGDVMSEPGRAVRVTVPLPSSVPPGAPRLGDDLRGADPVAGGRVRITGTGFQPYSTVVLAIYSTPKVLGSATVEEDGTFAATVTLPDGYVGEHALLASGVDADGDPRFMQLALTISEGGGGGLPVTGAPVWPVLAAGAGLVLGGGVLLVVARPRRRAAAVR